MSGPCDYLKGCDNKPMAFGPIQGGGLPNNPNFYSTRQYNLFTNFRTTVFSFKANGTQVNNEFPSIRRMASYRFETNVGLIAMRLTSSIINVTSGVNGTAGIFLAKDNGEIVSAGDGFDLYLDHITLKNSSSLNANPSNNRTQISFGDSTVIQLDSQQPISLYACGGNDADNLFSALAILYWIQINR
mgnify:CR=1 FL=1